jgi:signal transduction histidine kinase
MLPILSSLDRMSLRRKVQYALAIALFPVIVVLGATLWTVHASRDVNTAITKAVVPELLNLGDVREAGVRLIESLDALALTATILHDEPTKLAGVAARQHVSLAGVQANFTAAYAAFQALPLADSRDTAAARGDIAAAAQGLLAMPDRVEAVLAGMPSVADILKLRRQFKESAFQFRRLVDTALVTERRRLSAGGEDLRATIDRTIAIVLAGLLLSVLAYGLSTRHLGRHIVQPLISLRGAATRLGEGDFSVPLQRRTGDELGALVDAFIDMRTKLEGLTQLQIGIFEAAGEGICVFDKDMRLQAWNKTYADMLEFPPAFLRVGMAFADILRLRADRGEYGAESIETAIAGEMAAARTDNPTPIDHVTRSGRILERRRRPMPDGGWVTLFRDITERRAAEQATLAAKEAAEHANHVKTRFLANMSHELRTPLNAIIGFTEILQQESFGPLGDARYKEYVDDIHDGGRRLLANLTNVMDAVRIEGGEFTLNEDWLDLGEVVSAVADSFKSQIASARQSLDVALPVMPIEIKADERVLRRVLANLISNAVKFTPPDGKIRLSAGHAADGSIDVTVQDDGIGIRRADLQKVMAMFEQADGDLNRRYEGLGLGIPLSKALIELHGGRLSMISEPSHGTSVAIHLPPDRVRGGAVTPLRGAAG